MRTNKRAHDWMIILSHTRYPPNVLVTDAQKTVSPSLSLLLVLGAEQTHTAQNPLLRWVAASAWKIDLVNVGSKRSCAPPRVHVQRT